MSGEARGGAGWAGSACGIHTPPSGQPLMPPITQPRSRQGRTLAGHHGAGLKAVGAGTFETSDDVSAGAFATGVPDGALIYVWGRGEGSGQDPQRASRPRYLHIILSAPPECHPPHGA